MRSFRAQDTKSVAATGLVTIADFGFDAGDISETQAAYISASADIRFTWSGVDPTATLGHRLANGTYEVLGGANVLRLKMHGTATITVTIAR